MEKQSILLAKPLRILIVDDSRAIQAIIRRAIGMCGYEPIEITLASDGEQGIGHVEQSEPDLIITDWHMPKVTGLELLQAVRQSGHRRVRVGFVTTERSPTLLEQAKTNGAAFILHKPFEDTLLVSTVQTAIQDIIDERATPQADEKVTSDGCSDPVPNDALQIALANRLGNLPFRLIANDQLTPERMTPTSLLGLYSAAGLKGVYAIGVMDSNAVCMVGGGAARRTPADVRAAMSCGPEKLMLENGQQFLRDIAAVLTKTSVNHVNVTLANASVVKNTFGKLLEVVNQEGLRSDFRLSIPGYGEGRMAFFLLKQ